MPSTLSSPPVRPDTHEIIRMVDDFPAPLGPRNPNASPRRTSTSMPRTASNVPKCLVSALASTRFSTRPTLAKRSDTFLRIYHPPVPHPLRPAEGWLARMLSMGIELRWLTEADDTVL